MATDPDLTIFVREHIRSVWAVELLLLLRGDRARIWAPRELVLELRASNPLVEDTLRRLEASGLAAPDGDGYRYAPASPLLDALCGDLEAAYRARPVSVINMIARPSDPIQSLANAFRFKGEDR